jgi:hypothetical protein
MEDKPIKKAEEQPVVEKKAYTPPKLTVYGKLSELTGGGTKGTLESIGGPGKSRKTG